MLRIGWIVPLGLAMGPVACRQAPPPPPAATVSQVDGRIASIRMENINKAEGHYTYNVELDVQVTALDPQPPGWGAHGGKPLAVRVGTVSWVTLSSAEQAAVAPAGPEQHMEPAAWRQWRVGDDTHLRVVFTSPDLAVIVPGSAPAPKTP